VTTVDGWGYTGVIVLMAVESSFIPFPSEVVLIPSGLSSASRARWTRVWCLLASILGCLIGAFVNYGLALLVGRPFLERYGRYFFIAPSVLHKTDAFFARHGAISTFTGRLIPGIRQLISIPAGLARMRVATFAFYTGFGAGLWSLVLIALGYFIGDNEALIRENLPLVTFAALVFVALTLLVYVFWNRQRQLE
jgi:Uncharacterized membrane-associated protein